jgi:hypothetical protein
MLLKPSCSDTTVDLRSSLNLYEPRGEVPSTTPELDVHRLPVR